MTNSSLLSLLTTFFQPTNTPSHLPAPRLLLPCQALSSAVVVNPLLQSNNKIIPDLKCPKTLHALHVPPADLVKHLTTNDSESSTLTTHVETAASSCVSVPRVSTFSSMKVLQVCQMHYPCISAHRYDVAMYLYSFTLPETLCQAWDALM